ncbi:F-box-like domain protein, partial [Rhizoctonia solani 123E]
MKIMLNKVIAQFTQEDIEHHVSDFHSNRPPASPLSHLSVNFSATVLVMNMTNSGMASSPRPLTNIWMSMSMNSSRYVIKFVRPGAGRLSRQSPEQDFPKRSRVPTTDMIDELNHASFLLDNALDRYFMACSTIQDHYLQSESFGAIPNTLSQRVAHEALILNKYELKLQASTAKINWARNSSTHLVPINSLPPEVLTRVFQFALGPNNIGNMYRHPRLNRNNVRKTTCSDVLSHVCSYWRRVAFSSSQLWTRIDLSPCQVINRGLLPRSVAFTERAGGMLLDLYVTDPIREWSASATLNNFVQVVAPRLRSLNLRIYQTLRTDAYRSVLSASLLLCDPGTFTTLVATREPDILASTYIFFDMPDFGIPEHGVGFYQQIFTLANEAVLLSIKVMRLHACYPFWTSKAYYGLVELRLTPRTADVPISEAHLCDILQASPGLRILEFALKIVDFLPEGTTIPVRLDCLEVLNIRMMNYRLVPNLLRMI